MFVPEQTHRLPDKIPLWMHLKTAVTLIVLLMILASIGDMMGRAIYKGWMYVEDPSWNKGNLE